MAVIGLEWNQQDDIVNHLKLTTNKTLISLSDGYKRYEDAKDADAGVISSTTSIPIMTSNNSPQGEAIGSVPTGPAYNFWQSFNGNSSNGWLSASTPGVWLGYDFKKEVAIASYSLVPRGASIARTPNAWTFEGWNGIEWVALDSRENVTFASGTEKRSFNIKEPKKFSKYRIRISQFNDADYVGVGIFEMYEFEKPPIPATPPSWKTVSPTIPTLTQFQEEGMDDLSILDRKVQQVIGSPFQMTDEGVLGEGKVFKGTVDLKKIFDLRKLEVK